MPVNPSEKRPTLSFACLFAFWFACLMLLPHAPAVATQLGPEACWPLTPDPKIEVSAHTNLKPVYRTQPSELIGQSVKGQPQQVFLGLTRAALGMSITINPRIKTLTSDLLCISPEVNVRLYFDKLEVTTATDVEGNYCAENYVMNHEMQHVQFHLEAMIKTADAIRADLNREFPPGFRYIGVPGDLAYRKQRVSVGIASRVQAYFNHVNIRHRDIDNYVELQRSYQACDGVFLRLAIARQTKTPRL